MEPRPERSDGLISSGRMNAVGQKYDSQIFLEIQPKGGSGKSEVANTFPRKKPAGAGVGFRGGIKTQGAGCFWRLNLSGPKQTD